MTAWQSASQAKHSRSLALRVALHAAMPLERYTEELRKNNMNHIMTASPSFIVLATLS